MSGEDRALTKEQIKFLQSPKLRTLVFRHYVDSNAESWNPNKPFMVCLDAKHEDGIEVSSEIRLNHGRVVDYRKDGAPRRYKSLHDVVFVYHMDANPVTTFLDFLRPGDILELEWVLSNDNGYIEKTGEGGNERLFHDTLYVLVRRPTKRADKHGAVIEQRFKFWIDDSICADNSARWCNGK